MTKTSHFKSQSLTSSTSTYLNGSIYHLKKVYSMFEDNNNSLQPAKIHNFFYFYDFSFIKHTKKRTDSFIIHIQMVLIANAKTKLKEKL